MLEINFWVWSPAGPVGLKFTSPSAKLLITLIISNFFVPILREYACFLGIQTILFSFPSNLSHLYLSFQASWNLHVFLLRAGVSDAVLISLSSDDNAFLQRKSTVSLALVSFSTYFGSRFNSPKKKINTLNDQSKQNCKTHHLVCHSPFCFK